METLVSHGYFKDIWEKRKMCYMYFSIVIVSVKISNYLSEMNLFSYKRMISLYF